jgi:eukaryotic-like serine/threonine-protein kinase
MSLCSIHRPIFSLDRADFYQKLLAGSGDAERATIRAQIALVNQRPQYAVDMLQAALSVELGQSLSTQGPPCLYPVYVRGEAHLAAGHGDAAAAEFQKLIDHRGITWSCTTGALARLGLARAYALSGDKTKARVAYQDFLTLWKDGRPRHPHLETSEGGVRKAAISAVGHSPLTIIQFVWTE